MARMARKPKDDDGGEIAAKDFAGAVSTYRNDIKPAGAKGAEHMQEQSTGYKHIKKICNIQPGAAKQAFKLFDATEDAKRDDWLRCFVGIANEMAGETVLTFHSNDLVDQMSDTADAKKPSPRPKPQLVTVGGPQFGQPSDGTETDLADAAFEAAPEELAMQEGRSEPAPGTGAAARKAMKNAAKSGEDGGV